MDRRNGEWIVVGEGGNVGWKGGWYQLVRFLSHRFLVTSFVICDFLRGYQVKLSHN